MQNIGSQKTKRHTKTPGTDQINRHYIFRFSAAPYDSHIQHLKWCHQCIRIKNLTGQCFDMILYLLDKFWHKLRRSKQPPAIKLQNRLHHTIKASLKNHTPHKHDFPAVFPRLHWLPAIIRTIRRSPDPALD